MFDMTVEDEKSLLGELLRRTGNHPDNSCVIDSDGSWACPKCHEREIRTTCHVERHNGGLRSWRYEHRCDRCDEAFGINALQADIRLRSPFDALKSLETPFGTFHAFANDNELPIRHRVVSHDLGEGYGEIQFHKIDVDISGCSVGDVACCRFEDARLEFIGSDERVEYQCGVNSEYAIVISGYNPEFDIYRDTNYAK